MDRNKKRFNYILSQRDLEKCSSLKIDLDDELYTNLVEEAKKLNMTVEDIVYCFLIEMFMSEKRSKIKEENVIDMYDMYRIEEILDEEKIYFVATNKDPVVLIPSSNELFDIVLKTKSLE